MSSATALHEPHSDALRSRTILGLRVTYARFTCSKKKTAKACAACGVASVPAGGNEAGGLTAEGADPGIGEFTGEGDTAGSVFGSASSAEHPDTTAATTPAAITSLVRLTGADVSRLSLSAQPALWTSPGYATR